MGAYLWGRYDVLMLPRAYVFHGMENPRLTFEDSSILRLDTHAKALIAHELVHSWAGCLVTTANANHMWLNEGIGTYLELRIMKEVYGREISEGLAAEHLQDCAQT